MMATETYILTVAGVESTVVERLADSVRRCNNF